MSEDNLKLWNEVEKTDPAFTKQYKGKGGFQGTAICSQWQRYKATELWGAYGGKWGVKDEQYNSITTDDKHDAVLVYKATLYYPEGEFPICSDIDMWTYSVKYKSWSKNNDVHKKLSTDALTKGLSMLGFSADVFMGKFDDNKYVNEMKKEFAEDKEPQRNWITEIKTASSIEELKSIFGAGYKATEGEEKAKIKLEYDKRKTQIEEKE